MNYIRYINRLPYDIIYNYIIPYTYHLQSKSLLEDIQNYKKVKKSLLEIANLLGKPIQLVYKEISTLKEMGVVDF